MNNVYLRRNENYRQFLKHYLTLAQGTGSMIYYRAMESVPWATFVIWWGRTGDGSPVLLLILYN